MRQAAELAAAEINAKGGVKGRPLRLRVADDSGREDTAVRVAEELYGDPDVVAVLGHLTSGTTLSAARGYGGGGRPRPRVFPVPFRSRPRRGQPGFLFRGSDRPCPRAGARPLPPPAARS